VAAPIQTPTLLGHSVARSSLATPIRAAAIGLGVALTATAAQFTMPIPLTAVPFVFTPLAVVLTGAALGSRLGALTQALYVLIGAMGLAVFAPSPTLPPGLLRVLGPTGGYLLAYPLAAFVAGWLAERGWGRRYLTSLGAMLAGMAVIHIGGVSWLAIAFTHSLPAAIAAGSVQFLAADIMKAAVAALVLPQAWRLAGRPPVNGSDADC
jgi:biotin transport system substrate-specific component